MQFLIDRQSIDQIDSPVAKVLALVRVSRKIAPAIEGLSAKVSS